MNADTGLLVSSAIMPAMKKDRSWWLYIHLSDGAPPDIAQFHW